ncbi:unknown [Clostridium sp. CAG:914]|nr:unknown [Clostridium sp. CAG:914]
MSKQGKSRFSDRIKLIAKFKHKKNKNDEDNKLEKNTGFFKKIILVPLMLFGKGIEDLIKTTNKDKSNNITFNDKDDKSFNGKKMLEDDRTKHINIQSKKINVSQSKIKRNDYDDFKNKSFYNFNYVSSLTDIKELKKDILIGIRKNFIDEINKLEVLNSELYVLSKFDIDSSLLQECNDYLKKVKQLLDKLNKLNKRYNIYKENYYFENILDMDDKNLLDKILLFGELCNLEDRRNLVKDYKVLDTYKYLYSILEEVKEQCALLEEKSEEKIKELEDANIDFKKYQNDIFNKENIVSRCEFIYSKQEELLKEISSKVGNISSYESVRYNLSGFGSLLLNGIKLIGLFALSPFKGLFPSISLQTSLTKKTVSNLRKSIASTKKTEIVYTADDYIDKLNYSINEMDDMYKYISSTISDIDSLRDEYISKFSLYKEQLPNYNYYLKKINTLRKVMVNNQAKIVFLNKKIKENKKVNEKTLIRVKKLNEKS